MALQKLDKAAIDKALKDVPAWRVNDHGQIEHTYTFSDFIRAMHFVEKIAGCAERAQHHPDIDIRYNKVRLAVNTHDAGGLTTKDFDLAKQADAIAEGR